MTNRGSAYKKENLFCCRLDICNYPRHPVYQILKWKNDIEEELKKESFVFHKETFNTRYNDEKKQIECYVNFRTIEEAEDAVELFNRIKKDGIGIEYEKYVNVNVYVYIQNCCTVDISNTDILNKSNQSKFEDSVEYWGKFIKKELENKRFDFHEKTFNISYNRENKKIQCYVNFDTIDKAHGAVELFNRIKKDGIGIESKYLNPYAPPDNWIKCPNQAQELIKGKLIILSK